MAVFKRAHAKTSKNEGGYSNHSQDKGGETYRGITMKFFPNWEGWEIVHKTIERLNVGNTLDCPKAVRTQIDNALAHIPELNEMVEKFYKKEFWDALDLDSEEDQLIADEVFDTAVNMGVASAKAMLEEARKDNA